MKKTFFIAKANVLRYKSASLSLFIMILIASILMTTGASILFGLRQGFEKSVNLMNTAHSHLVMTRNMYDSGFEALIQNDSRVEQYEISEVLSPRTVTLQYGGEIDVGILVMNLDTPVKISPPAITEQTLSIPREKTIYLPAHAKSLGFNLGDDFALTYKNKPIPLTVAGFFEINEFATVNAGMMIAFFAPQECFDMLKQQFGSAVLLTFRFFDQNISQQFNQDFSSKIDVELADFVFTADSSRLADAAITPVSIVTAILIIFALIIVVITLLAIRFRITNSIDNTMHEIGVLQSAGYTNRQIITCYGMEYGVISLPAALLGVALSIPIFPLVCKVMTSASGFLWFMEANVPVGVAAAFAMAAILLAMVLRSCHKIKKLSPVTALRRGIAANSFRRNFFPLHRGMGNVHTRLGLKNIFVFLKTYMMTGVIIAVMCFATVCVAVMYQNFAIDQHTFIKMAGIEAHDAQISVTRHTDADALAARLAKMPEVRKTSMLDVVFSKADNIEVICYISDDYDQLEDMATHHGRFPIYDNEVALPKLFADHLGKQIGDSIAVNASGVSQEYLITGFFSASSNIGRVIAMPLAGYQKLAPNYKRSTINIYFGESVSFDSFAAKMKQDYGVLNVYEQDSSVAFSAAKAVAEEKISNYLEHYNIDSAAYAAIYNGEIILSGSSNTYQIERIINSRETLKSTLGSYVRITAVLVQVVAVLSLLIISAIISMTVRIIVTHRYRELGTLKALGFTTNQLAMQLATSFVPCAAIGVTTGCIIGVLAASPLLSSMFSGLGAYGNVFAVNPFMVLMIGALFLLAAVTVANISANSIRNISAYDLISDMRPVRKKRKKLTFRKTMSLLVAGLVCFSAAAIPAASADSVLRPEAGLAAQTENRLYGIGSVSKIVTAAAVMKLAEEGKLNLDAPLTSYMPDFRMADARHVRITPRMLLNHSGGFMGTIGNNSMLLGDDAAYAHDRFLTLLASQTLKHDPGERSIYCNDGFTLAEILVERISGISFTDFIETRFAAPLGLQNLKTPQSDFVRTRLASIYLGNNALKPENVGFIGSGGIYATMEDLCRFATLFMDNADGAILSKQSANEMAKNQHRNEMIPADADTTLRYGLGWDCVEDYPFSQYGIQALSKGGATGRYHSNLTVLPRYNLAVAVASSGTDSQEHLIAQEIILAVLREEGLIPESAPPVPEPNPERTKVPESVKAYAGIYDAGSMGRWNAAFTDDSLILTRIMAQIERPQEYFYDKDGQFVSANNDYVSMNAALEGIHGTATLHFAEERYLIAQIHEQLPGLGTTAMAMPLAEKLENNDVPLAATEAWASGNEKEYLLVSEKYSSAQYLGHAVAKTLVDDRAYGYVGMGIYRGSGASFSLAKITDGTTASGFQSTPTMTGRDTNDLSITRRNGVEYLGINHFQYINAAAAHALANMGSAVVIGSETVWVDIGSDMGGRVLHITTPPNGAWFAYDAKMNCVATSLEDKLRYTIILPQDGRLAFAGDAGAAFALEMKLL